MTLEVLILFHILLLTYWLGADLGVFYSSRYVIKPDLEPGSRATALKIMAWLDMAPRYSLVLFLPSGVSLMAASEYSDVTVFDRQINLVGWPLILTWAFALFWLYLVWADHHYSGQPRGQQAKTVDLYIRLALIVGLLAAGLYTVIATDPFGVTTNPKWLGAKVALYAVAMLFGVAIRFRLKPFGPSFMALMTTGSTPEVEDGIGGAIQRSVPFVLGIWVLVFVIAALGVIKPGAFG